MDVYFDVARIHFGGIVGLRRCMECNMYRHVNSHCIVDNSTEYFTTCIKYLILFFFYVVSFKKGRNAIKSNQYSRRYLHFDITH